MESLLFGPPSLLSEPGRAGPSRAEPGRLYYCMYHHPSLLNLIHHSIYCCYFTAVADAALSPWHNLSSLAIVSQAGFERSKHYHDE